MDFRSLPSRPDHPRYTKRVREIDTLLLQKKDRLVEEGMLKDAAMAVDDLWWFGKRFTSFASFRIAEKGHPLQGKLWIDHPFIFWLSRQYQAVYDAPAGDPFWPNGEPGWVWFKIHRAAMKTTLLLASILWLGARDEMETVILATHKADEIGSGMGKGLLAEIQNDKLKDHFAQFRDMREGKQLGYTLDRPAGPREQSLMVASIMTSAASIHPGRFAFDDAVSDKLRDNPGQIAVVSKNISSYVSLMPPDASVIVCNTPYDEADPWIEREKAGLFAKVISQSATSGGDFTGPGEPNLYSRKHFDIIRKQTKDDSVYFPQFELIFHRSAASVFDWAWMKEYHEDPEDLARHSPFINIIVDGAGGKNKKKSDFTVVRVITWTAHDAWANLELIRERVGISKTMQILLGRDDSDPTTRWIEQPVPGGFRAYSHAGVGVVEKWMQIDPNLTIWFDDHGNAGWKESFLEHIRLRSIAFAGGKVPTVRAWPEIHKTRSGGEQGKSRDGFTKLWRIGQLETPYQGGKVAYPAKGFGHGCWNGVAGGPDTRDTKTQFQQDEFNRMKLDTLPPHDDMLDNESILALPQALALMRRPAKGAAYEFGGIVYPMPTIDNPFGIPGGAIMPPMKKGGRSWVSLL